MKRCSSFGGRTGARPQDLPRVPEGRTSLGINSPGLLWLPVPAGNKPLTFSKAESTKQTSHHEAVSPLPGGPGPLLPQG